MDRQNHFKQEAARFLKEAIGDAKQTTDDLLKPYQMMERIKTREDIEAAITKTLASYENLRKRKGLFDSRRIWSFFCFTLMITGVVTIKSLIASGFFLFGAIIAVFIFSKAHQAASPLEMETKAYDAVLLKLLEMKILCEQAANSRADVTNSRLR
jgi:hypothetical protein